MYYPMESSLLAQVPRNRTSSPAVIRGKSEWGRLLRDVLKMEADESNS